ncbi:NADH-quinone oxidoreductase subunit C [Streptomyces sp. NPDC059092]|uniref:NADH-quinone oxidoreductase subunit C n=1 Tax=Streptomyces sp. NPDC059092 TaxID=3346725 RepID=UPI0036D0E459
MNSSDNSSGQASAASAASYDRLPDAAAEIFGEGATAELTYDLLTVDVPAASWISALETARSTLGCTYFDWLSAVDEPGTGFRVCAHVAAVGPGKVRRLLVRTTVPHDAAVLPTAIGVYAGAGWHERETYEMFGVAFTDHPNLVPLLLPEAFEGHPLRKDFVLAARVAKAWPGAKEPGESEHGGPKRRQMLPPGVPDPNEWGPLKGQLPPAPARPARGARAAGAAGAAAGDRPARRTRAATDEGGTTPGAAPSPAPARRARSVSEGSTSQRPEPPTADAPWRRQTPAPTPSTDGTEPAERTDTTPPPEAAPGAPEAKPEPRVEPEPRAEPEPDTKPDPSPEPRPQPHPGPRPEADRPESEGDA